ncbi:cellulose binding domain-containing protein [Actinoplanes regularis]|uniref:Cellulose binding domain-containing protein n=1 Tax=Actinoplanes regularis TaxID=52697 RepID=A0A239BTQ6_9ACTN|nr:cellulose binding domain-containing protein [Actinoplanes regularis]GIE88301.1 hypothetical protein Are01nite_47810 [Actinoplanes regularis]SNS11032.1 Cellulose binding domain-containing protein [Actinoplanes regularis]
MKRSTFREGGFRQGFGDLLPWTPTAVGVGALLCMVTVTGFRLLPEEQSGAAAGPEAIPPVPGAAPSSSGVPSATGTPADPSAGSSAGTPADPSAASGSATARPSWSSLPVVLSPTTRAPSSRPPTSRTTAPSVTGRYSVVGSYDAEFIGEVRVGNSTGSPVDWVVVLRFPGNVGDLRTSWVESAPQATLSRSGESFVWRSGVPVDGSSSVVLRFQFARTGTGDRPSSCTVNGTPCA